LKAITNGGFPKAQVIVIDPHGEYGTAFDGFSRVYSIGDTKHRFYLPYWCLSFDELGWFLVDRRALHQRAFRTAICATRFSSFGRRLPRIASLSVNAVHEPWNRSPRRLAHADTLARAINLDMAAAGWSPTVDNYFGRVPKARILEAVREAKGEHSAQLIDHLKKPDMAKEAERLLVGTGWLPEPLRTPAESAAQTDAGAATEPLPAFLADEGDGVDEQAASDPEEAQSPAVAAE
jgi:hypothetical protein